MKRIVASVVVFLLFSFVSPLLPSVIGPIGPGVVYGPEPDMTLVSTADCDIDRGMTYRGAPFAVTAEPPICIAARNSLHVLSFFLNEGLFAVATICIFLIARKNRDKKE